MLAILVPVLLIAGCSPNPAPTPTEGTNVGNLAPDFQLYNLDGESVSLSDFRGKPVRINFWAIWCSACRSEMPYLQQVYEEWSTKRLVLLAINMGDNPSQVREFIQDQNFSFPVLLDTALDIAQKYNIRFAPTTFLIDKDGVIQNVKIGASSSKSEMESDFSKIIP